MERATHLLSSSARLTAWAQVSSPAPTPNPPSPLVDCLQVASRKTASGVLSQGFQAAMTSSAAGVGLSGMGVGFAFKGEARPEAQWRRTPQGGSNPYFSPGPL